MEKLSIILAELEEDETIPIKIVKQIPKGEWEG